MQNTTKGKITEIQAVVIDMEIRQHTKTANILVAIFTVNVLTKGPEGHIANVSSNTDLQGEAQNTADAACN